MIPGQSGYKKCRLTRLKAGALLGETPLRTTVIEGECYGRPTVGQSFKVWNDQPLDTSFGATQRMVTTSIVMETSGHETAVTFKTETGSIYQWEEIFK